MFVKYASAVTSGTFVTLSLLYVMQYLIVQQPVPPGEERERRTLDWLSEIIERPVERVDERPPLEQLKEPVDPTPPRPLTESSGEIVGVRPPTPTVPGPDNSIVPGSGFSNGPLVAIVRVEPQYPARLQAAGIEGYVDVQFDVLPDGSVNNVSVVESSHSGFESAAIKAAQRFRFKARVVDGVPLTSYGIRNRFRFRMGQG